MISTCSISTIHSHICCVGVVVGFFVDELYKKENYLVSPPGAIAIVWMLWTSYMLTDLSAHIICFCIKPIPYRVDVIAHHTFAYLTVYLLNYPTPIYAWLVLCAPLLTEFSTIFMNFRWFAKHYNYSHKLQKILNNAFVSTWFIIRYPAIFSMVVFLIYNWHSIWIIVPVRVAVCGTILILCINLLHIVWAYLLINKIIANRKKNKHKHQLRLNGNDHHTEIKDSLPSDDHSKIIDDDKNGETETDSLL